MGVLIVAMLDLDMSTSEKRVGFAKAKWLVEMHVSCFGDFVRDLKG